MQIAGDPRSQPLDLEQSRDAMAVVRIPGCGDQQRTRGKEPPSLPDGLQDREGHRCGRLLVRRPH